MQTDNRKTDTSQAEEPVPAPAKRLRVLLVDDVPENLTLMSDVFAEEGFDTMTAADGIEALLRLESEEIHLIVADAMMPRMDGFTFCKEVRSHTTWRHIPFVIYTANFIDRSEKEFARRLGVDRYVVKFAGLDALLEAVNELAAERYGRTLSSAEENHRPTLSDRAFLEEHRAIVVRKLEEKMVELQQYADTLARKNAELQASEDRYRRLFDHASIAIFVADRHSGRILDVNPRGVALLGRTRETIRDLPALPFADPGFWKKVQETRNFVLGETMIDTLGAGTISVEVGVAPLTVGDESSVLLYVRDITEQKRMRDQLLQVEKMALMGRIAAGIAHEVRNPLSAISLNLQFLVQKLDRKQALREAALDAFAGAQRVNTVIENTLSLARVQPPELRRENINDLVQTVLGFLRVTVRQKDIVIETSLTDDPPMIAADAQQVYQVLLNVLHNAVDASQDHGRIEISTGVAERMLPVRGATASCVVVTVRDHGAGIPPDLRQHLFEEFFTTKIGGTGLGLALSRQIMDRHRGDIRVEPASAGGTAVELVFPTL